MINPYNICYQCPKCDKLRITDECVNFGTTQQNLDGKNVIDAYRLASHSNVPQNILDLLKSNWHCGSCGVSLAYLTVTDLFVKRAEHLKQI